jgi:putative addiction module CopG family antidote
MNVELDPTLEKFIDEQVKQGRFSSHSEALEAGVARLMLDPEPDTLDARDVAEIRESLAQMRRGESIDFKEFAARMRQKHLR